MFKLCRRHYHQFMVWYYTPEIGALLSKLEVLIDELLKAHTHYLMKRNTSSIEDIKDYMTVFYRQSADYYQLIQTINKYPLSLNHMQRYASLIARAGQHPYIR